MKLHSGKYQCYDEGVFAQTQTWGHGHSGTCAVVQHTFDLLDYTNMLIDEGTMEYP